MPLSNVIHMLFEETSQHYRGVSRTSTIILKKFKYIGQCKPFLDGIQSCLAAKKLKQCLEESWPFILQAISLDAVPVDGKASGSSRTEENTSKSAFFSAYNMVELKQQDYQFLWSFSLLVIFQGQHATPDKTIIPLDYVKSIFDSDSPVACKHAVAMKFYEVILPVSGFLSAEKFFATGFLTIDLCRELLQVFSYYIFMEDILDSHAISVLSQIVQNCPKVFFETEDFAYQAAELCLSFIFKFLQSPINLQTRLSILYGTKLKERGVALDVFNFYLSGTYRYARKDLDVLVTTVNDNGNSHIVDVVDESSVCGILSESILRKNLHYLEKKAAADDEYVEAPGIQFVKPKLEWFHNEKNKSAADDKCVQAPGIENLSKKTPPSL